MLCKTCKNDFPLEDFFNSDNCYKCEYKRKCIQPKRRCLMCNDVLESTRWKYCGEECARKSEKTYVGWERRIRIVKWNWRHYKF